jgi:diaminopimelate decarboxylase
MDPRAIRPESLADDARTETHARRCRALKRLVELGHLDANDGDASDDDANDATTASTSPSRDVALLVDLDALSTSARLLQRDAGFPANTMHTFAVKANPCEGVLRAFRALGFGAEVASLGELEAALSAGFPPDQVVFDSPCKTRRELKRALTAGVRVNLDSLAEIERVAALLDGTSWGREIQRRWEQQQEVEDEATAAAVAPVIGVRVNPQVGAGSIAALSTSTDDSKFGVPILPEEGGGVGGERAALAAAFARHSWLRALHLHVGSQGVPLEAVAEGAARAWQFWRDLRLPAGRWLLAFDVGGGTPVDFSSDAEYARAPPFAELARLLRERVPELWEGAEGGVNAPPPPLLITENGRALVAKAGCVAARVEYVKHQRGDDGEDGEEDEQPPRRKRRPIAVVHAGADLLMRACYLPQQWSLRLFVVDGATFSPRELQASPPRLLLQDVAGPLCFQGDRLAVARLLPALKEGDWVVVADAGAYTLSMWSHYNSRQSPCVWGYRGGGGEEGRELEMKLLRRGDTIGEVVGFWAVER